MEAIGKSREADCSPVPEAEQVQERPARTWFDRAIVERTVVRYHPRATWTQRELAVSLARMQDPDPYSIFTRKTTHDKWYCSKLVWWVYRRAQGDNLDPDWGFWVTPDDLRRSGNLTTVLDYTRTR